MGMWRHTEWYQNLTLLSGIASLYQLMQLLVNRSLRKKKRSFFSMKIFKVDLLGNNIMSVGPLLKIIDV